MILKSPSRSNHSLDHDQDLQQEQEMSPGEPSPLQAPPTNFVPDVVGGQNLTTSRAYFDQNDENVIVLSERGLLYFDIESGRQVAQADLKAGKLEVDEHLVSSDTVDNMMYLFTNYGQILTWNLETRDWSNELYLPVFPGESLVTCKMLCKRQYIYSIRSHATNSVDLYFSASRSERERPKKRELIEKSIQDGINAIDIGCLTNARAPSPVKSSQQQAKQRCLVFIKGSCIHFMKVGIGEKFIKYKASKQRIQGEKFVCVRANPHIPMVAAGDTLGRIYLYTGDFAADQFSRTKLHWHSLPVNDLCFSSTGYTLYSVGGESGCVVTWDLSPNNIGKKHVIPRLGMPIRYVNCSNSINKLILSFEDNQLQTMDTDGKSRELKTLTRRTIDMYIKNDPSVLRKAGDPDATLVQKYSIGLLAQLKNDTVVTNGRTGWLQFYSPKDKSRVNSLNFLKSNILSVENESNVIPSEITRATLTIDGNWLALYETRDSPDSCFPDVRLHIWHHSNISNRWAWVQTADRLHTSTTITDLRFSPDGQYLISVSEDGSFQILHRVCLDAKANPNSTSNKQMYAKGFLGNVPDKLAALATFSHDSSVMAISLKNDTTLIWMIADPYKLVFECQLSQIDVDEGESAVNDNDHEFRPHHVLGLHFGRHEPSQSVAPLCEVRTKSVRLWNILNPQETAEFRAKSVVNPDGSKRDDEEFTATAFDHGSQDSDHFAVSTKRNQILIFKLHIERNSATELKPLIIFDTTALFMNPGMKPYYTHMCFMANPILDIDDQCHPDPVLLRVINRLCLVSNDQKLIAITDKLTMERKSASNNCNAINTLDMSELQSYFSKNVSQYHDETRNLSESTKVDNQTITEKQRRIRNRLEVQKMLKDLFARVPSQNLPQMERLGPMIIDKLVQ